MSFKELMNTKISFIPLIYYAIFSGFLSLMWEMSWQEKSLKYCLINILIIIFEWIRTYYGRKE